MENICFGWSLTSCESHNFFVRANLALMELNDAQRARVEQSRAAALARKAALQEAIFYSGG